jgi:hypothetical protein
MALTKDKPGERSLRTMTGKRSLSRTMTQRNDKWSGDKLTLKNDDSGEESPSGTTAQKSDGWSGDDHPKERWSF